MKTDIEKLKDLFDEWGVGYEIREDEGTRTISTESGDKKVKGYALFYTDFVFNEKGEFDHMGAWE